MKAKIFLVGVMVLAVALSGCLEQPGLVGGSLEGNVKDLKHKSCLNECRLDFLEITFNKYVACTDTALADENNPVQKYLENECGMLKAASTSPDYLSFNTCKEICDDFLE